jgi:hypothetical protein
LSRGGDGIGVAGAGPGGQAVYLFALLDGAAEADAADAAGAAFAPPTLYREGSIAALISTVPLSDYCGEDAADRLRDLAWLAPRTLYHAAMLQRAMASSPVYPVPFATLFANLDSLSAFMLAHAPTLLDFFRATAGLAEWELKLSARVDDRPALEAMARDTWPDWAALNPGTRYLRLCRDRVGLIAARRLVVRDGAARIARRLRPPATDLRDRGLPPQAAGGDELVGRFALLAALDALDADGVLARRLRQLTDDAEADGIALSLSGPWPPFSFRPDLPHPARPAEE